MIKLFADVAGLDSKRALQHTKALVGIVCDKDLAMEYRESNGNRGRPALTGLIPQRCELDIRSLISGGNGKKASKKTEPEIVESIAEPQIKPTVGLEPGTVLFIDLDNVLCDFCRGNRFSFLDLYEKVIRYCLEDGHPVKLPLAITHESTPESDLQYVTQYNIRTAFGPRIKPSSPDTVDDTIKFWMDFIMRYTKLATIAVLSRDRDFLANLTALEQEGRRGLRIMPGDYDNGEIHISRFGSVIDKFIVEKDAGSNYLPEHYDMMDLSVRKYLQEEEMDVSTHEFVEQVIKSLIRFRGEKPMSFNPLLVKTWHDFNDRNSRMFFRRDQVKRVMECLVKRGYISKILANRSTIYKIDGKLSVKE
jgi:hypothetical protein